jgi:hypothetical protein
VNTTQEQGNKLTFMCECHGCRNYPTRPAEIWHESQIPSKEKGTYFFTKETMKFFSSRIVDFKPVGVFGEVDSLSVIVSSRHGYEGSTRYYEIVTLCPFGTINRESDKFDSLRLARKNWDYTRKPAPVCSCHGCQIDKAGR